MADQAETVPTETPSTAPPTTQPAHAPTAPVNMQALVDEAVKCGVCVACVLRYLGCRYIQAYADPDKVRGGAMRWIIDRLIRFVRVWCRLCSLSTASLFPLQHLSACAVRARACSRCA